MSNPCRTTSMELNDLIQGRTQLERDLQQFENEKRFFREQLQAEKESLDQMRRDLERIREDIFKNNNNNNNNNNLSRSQDASIKASSFTTASTSDGVFVTTTTIASTSTPKSDAIYREKRKSAPSNTLLLLSNINEDDNDNYNDNNNNNKDIPKKSRRKSVPSKTGHRDGGGGGGNREAGVVEGGDRDDGDDGGDGDNGGAYAVLVPHKSSKSIKEEKIAKLRQDQFPKVTPTNSGTGIPLPTPKEGTAGNSSSGKKEKEKEKERKVTLTSGSKGATVGQQTTTTQPQVQVQAQQQQQKFPKEAKKIDLNKLKDNKDKDKDRMPSPRGGITETSSNTPRGSTPRNDPPPPKSAKDKKPDKADKPEKPDKSEKMNKTESKKYRKSDLMPFINTSASGKTKTDAWAPQTMNNNDINSNSSPITTPTSNSKYHPTAVERLIKIKKSISPRSESPPSSTTTSHDIVVDHHGTVDSRLSAQGVVGDAQMSTKGKHKKRHEVTTQHKGMKKKNSKQTEEGSGGGGGEGKVDIEKAKEVKRRRQIKKIHRKNSDAIPERTKQEKKKSSNANEKINNNKNNNNNNPPIVEVVKKVEVEETDSTTTTPSNPNISEKESDTSNSETAKKRAEDGKKRVTKRKRVVANPATTTITTTTTTTTTTTITAITPTPVFTVTTPLTPTPPTSTMSVSTTTTISTNNNINTSLITSNKTAPSTSESEQFPLVQPAAVQDFSQEGLDRLPEDFFTSGEVVNSMLELYLSQNYLCRIPEDIGLCTGLVILDLSYNNILVLPPAIGNLQSLKKLILSGNPYIKLPSEIVRLNKLLSIRLNQNKYIEIPEEVYSLPSLIKINLSNNNIFKISPKISLLTSLESLNLSYNKLTEIPPQIGMCTSLNYVSLRNNSLKCLPPEFCNLEALETLILQYNNLSRFPDNFKLSQFPEMALIDVQYNQIESLVPDFFAGTTKFQELYAGHNKLTSLPPSLSLCSTLTILDFKNNSISDPLPPFKYLTKLTQLVLGQNKLSSFPIGIGNCISLKTLNLFGNSIPSIPAELHNLIQLKHIYLGYNQITEFNFLGEVTNSNLKELFISGNPVVNLPKQFIIRNWDLTYLYLNSMNLREVPRDIGLLRNLVQLDLSHNKISTLPVDMCNMVSLYSLDVSHNLLVNTERPDADEKRWDKEDWWVHLDNIGVIDLSWNKLTSPPVGLLSLCENSLLEVILDHNPFSKSVKPSEIDFFDPRQMGNFSMGWSELVGQRPTQEDCFLINGCVVDNNVEFGIFALFDGHVSRAAAQFASLNFIEHLLQFAPFNEEENAPLKSLRKTFYSINQVWREMVSSPECLADNAYRMCGSTGVVVLIMNDHMYVANAGDSRAVLYKGGSNWEVGQPVEMMEPFVERLTHDHKPEHDDEENRIREAGGYVVNGRMGGILGVSRGIGDFYLYPLVSAKAHLRHCPLPRNEDAFLLVCCDGVWDELSDVDAVCLVHQAITNENRDLHYSATKLRDYSFLMGSDDNISTLIVRWNNQ